MRIAQVAPLAESVPPPLYGGTERVVSYLTEELTRLGHDVTLFASGDSVTMARLEAVIPRALRLDATVHDSIPYHVMLLDAVRATESSFDILHFHLDYLHFPLFRDTPLRTLTTLHGRLDLPDLWPLYNRFPEMPLVSISNSQRQPMPPVFWAGTVYHGLPAERFLCDATRRRSYLAFLGRISPEKRADRAIEIARRAGLPIKIAAKVDKVDQCYFDAVIRPLLDDPLVEFVGEIGEAEKSAFLGGAKALLFPIDWVEPFGLVMIEAMACGTPVIAWPCGSVPEIVDEGETGFIVDSIDAAVGAIAQAETLSPARIRARFEERFSARRMATDYLKIYESLIALSAGVPSIGARGNGTEQPLPTVLAQVAHAKLVHEEARGPARGSVEPEGAT